MNGMHQEQYWAYTTGSDMYSVSHQYELPPTPTCAQISLADYYEFDDKSQVDLGFTSCTYVDKDGVTRNDSFPSIDDFDVTYIFARNGLASATFELSVSNVYAAYIVNFFFWDSVS